MKPELKHFTIIGLLGCVVVILLNGLNGKIIYEITYVIYEKLFIISDLLFTVAFAGYYFLQKTKNITKTLSLCALILGVISTISSMLGAVLLSTTVYYTVTTYVYPLGWIVFFIGLFLYKSVDKTIRYLSLASSIILILNLIFHIPVAVGSRLLSNIFNITRLITFVLMLRLQIINTRKVEVSQDVE